MGDKNIREVFNVEAERRAYMADKRITGRPLLQVFGVMINNIDKENPGDLYGNITVNYGGKSQCLYNRGKSNSELVRPGVRATLTGPAEECISASQGFVIDVDLMDRDSFPGLTKDDQISKGKITCTSDNTSNKCDVLLSEEISARFGKATIFYAVFSDAVQARVEVKLLNGDNENPADVYGVVAVAYDGKPGFEDYHDLFRRSSAGTVDVRPQQPIPLDRSLVVVPLDSKLKVNAELKDYDIGSPDEQIAKGTVTFLAQLSGTSEQIITGKDGSIQVKVTWTS